MAELRWNPLLDTFSMMASNRQHRPHLPNNWCAFCPGEGKKVPANFDVLAYPNDFPVLSQQPETINISNTSITKNKKAYGKCEVILYSPQHNIKLYELADAHILKLIQLWKSRFENLANDKKIKYIFEFENKGEEVGVTMPHPHGQLYAYSWIPSKIKTELDNCKKYFRKHKRNLFDDLNQSEKQYQKRVVAENDYFVAYIPYFTDYPFGVFIVAKTNLQNFTEFNDAEMKAFGNLLKQLTKGFDAIYDRPFPYIMAIHQSPVNTKKYANCATYFRFHVEFYPPLRAKDKIKYYAGSEMGAGAAANPLDIDECALLLKNKIEEQ